jgi:hypothetical protein
MGQCIEIIESLGQCIEIIESMGQCMKAGMLSLAAGF